MTLQRGEHRALCQLDTLDQRQKTCIASLACLGRNGIKRAAQVIGNREHIAGEIGHGIGARIANVPRRAAAKIVHLRGKPQILVLQLVPLRCKQFKRRRLRRCSGCILCTLGGLHAGFLRCFGSGLIGGLRLGLFAPTRFLCLIGHDATFPS